MADLIKIGQITGPHGVQGEVRVYPLTDFPERFRTPGRVFLGPECRPVHIQMTGKVRNLVILKIQGVDDYDQAEKLRQQYLQVPKSEAFPLPEGYTYIWDLIGLQVVDPEGNLLGTLVDVDHSSTVHDLYVVETAPGKRFMVPAVSAFVREIDLPNRQIVIQPIPGLLED